MNQKLVTRAITEDEYSIWDNFVQESPQGTVFHNTQWILASASAKKSNFELIGVFDDDKLIGGCPLFYLKKCGFLKIIISAEQLSGTTGIMLPKRENTKVRTNLTREHEILDLIRKYIEKKQWLYSFIINNSKLEDVRPFTWNYWQTAVSYTYMLSLPFDINNTSRKLRATIRKAKEVEGIIIDKSFDADLIFDLSAETYNKQGIDYSGNKDYLITLVNMIQENEFGEMLIARLPNGEPISATIGIWDKDTVHRWVAYTKPQFLATGVDSLLLYKLIELAGYDGMKYVNLMAAGFPFLTNFVSSFNPELVPQYTVHKSKIPYLSLLPLRKRYYK